MRDFTKIHKPDELADALTGATVNSFRMDGPRMTFELTSVGGEPFKLVVWPDAALSTLVQGNRTIITLNPAMVFRLENLAAPVERPAP